MIDRSVPSYHPAARSRVTAPPSACGSRQCGQRLTRGGSGSLHQGQTGEVINRTRCQHGPQTIPRVGSLSRVSQTAHAGAHATLSSPSTI